MLLRGRLANSDVTLSLQPHWLTIGVDETLVVSWDRGGRLYSLYQDQATAGILDASGHARPVSAHTFRRGLNGRVLEKWQDAGGVRHWDVLPGRRAESLVDDGARLAARVRGAIARPGWEWVSEPPGTMTGALEQALDAAAAFTGDASRRDAVRFAEIYSPIGILPPDQYLSVIVQATEGCSFNTCTFCDLYEGRYRVKTVAEFEQHLAEARQWLGASLGLRGRGLFVGSANALAVPMARLVPMFDAIGRAFPEARGRASAFLDGFTGLCKSAADFASLRDRGLQRVYIGLESGHDALLAFVRKPAMGAQAVDTVRAIKQSGVHVGVIVMIGLGGEAFADAHVTDTIAALNAMALDEHDLVYFSDLVEQPGTPYPALAAAQGIPPLPPASRPVQRHAIRDGVRGNPGLPRFATYDVREFVY